MECTSDNSGEVSGQNDALSITIQELEIAQQLILSIPDQNDASGTVHHRSEVLHPAICIPTSLPFAADPNQFERIKLLNERQRKSRCKQIRRNSTRHSAKSQPNSTSVPRIPVPPPSALHKNSPCTMGTTPSKAPTSPEPLLSIARPSRNAARAFTRSTNALLLQSLALRALNRPLPALALAERAVYLAEHQSYYDEASKAQLYRGLCLLDMGHFAEASWCFTRGASRRWWGVDAARWKSVAERKRGACVEGDWRRELGKEFKTVPEIC